MYSIVCQSFAFSGEFLRELERCRRPLNNKIWISGRLIGIEAFNPRIARRDQDAEKKEEKEQVFFTVSLSLVEDRKSVV